MAKKKDETSGAPREAWLRGHALAGGATLTLAHDLGVEPDQAFFTKVIGGDGRLAIVRLTDKEVEVRNGAAMPATFDLYLR